MIRASSALATTSGILLVAGLASGQTESGPGWRIVPYAGEYVVDDTDGVDLASGSAGLTLGAIIGVAADFDAPVPFLGFRIGAERTLGSELVAGAGVAEANVRSVSLDARIQPVPRSWAARPFVFIGAERLQFDFEGARDFAFGIDSKNQVASRFGYGADLDVLGGSFRIEAIHRKYTAEEVQVPGESVEVFEPLRNTNFALVAGLRIGVR